MRNRCVLCHQAVRHLKVNCWIRVCGLQLLILLPTTSPFWSSPFKWSCKIFTQNKNVSRITVLWKLVTVGKTVTRSNAVQGRSSPTVEVDTSCYYSLWKALLPGQHPSRLQPILEHFHARVTLTFSVWWLAWWLYRSYASTHVVLQENMQCPVGDQRQTSGFRSQL